MKKNVLSVLFLTTGILLASCGTAGGEQGDATALDTAGTGYQVSAEPGGEAGAGTAAEDPSGKEISGDGLAGGEGSSAGKEGVETEENWEEEEVFLSDQILHAGDILSVMYYQDENTLSRELDITLHKAGLYDSPEAAGLGNVEFEDETEVYDRDGNPELCSTAGMRILSCDLTVQNIDAVGGSDQHISAIMLAYADPDTRKVTMVSCAPAYFSASSSQVGSGDYYHYQLPKGDSKDMTVAWSVPDEYEAENLYLCVTYDNRDPEERQYFRLVE